MAHWNLVAYIKTSTLPSAFTKMGFFCSTRNSIVVMMALAVVVMELVSYFHFATYSISLPPNPYFN